MAFAGGSTTLGLGSRVGIFGFRVHGLGLRALRFWGFRFRV